MTAPHPVLRDQDLSAVYRSADALSGRGQRRTRQLVRAELICVVLAGVAGLGSFRVGPAQLDMLAALAGALFVAALVCTVVRSLRKPESHWYRGRAAAESVRTLAWRYAVGGEPFGLDEPDREVSLRYLDRLDEILDEMGEAELRVDPLDADELTEPMRALRRKSLAERKAAYRQDRIEDQRRWYARRAEQHRGKARLWLAVTCLASALGVIAAGVKFAGPIDIDLLGVFGACASAAIAWNQLGQNRNQVSAYSVASSELRIISARIEYVDQTQWAQFVSDAEDAISREHTLWLARRGELHPRG